MLVGIIIGILIWQFVSLITYIIFDNESKNFICGGIFFPIALLGCNIINAIRRKIKKENT